MPDSTQSFGKYDNLKQIGRGGFATVYSATDSTLGREVALKILHPHYALEPDFAERFLHEARTVAALDHPNIVTLYEVGDLDGQLFIAMELVDGGSLHERLQQAGPMSAVETATLLAGVADALDYAHSNGLIHRDIKPANILLKTSHRDTLRPILTDFGLVKALTANTQLTRSGTILGTLEYMAPEQIDAEYAGEIGPAADIYALGIVAYHMLTGQVPFTGSTVRVMNGHLTKTPPAPSAVRADLPQGLSDAVLKALEKRPEDRFASATAFVEALRAGISAAPAAPPPVLESAPVDATPPPAVVEPPPPVRETVKKAEPAAVVMAPPPAAAPPPVADSTSSSRSRIPLILAVIAVVAVIALAATLRAMLGGNIENRKATEQARQDATATTAAQFAAQNTQVARADATATAAVRRTTSTPTPPLITPTPDLTATVEYKTGVTRAELSGYLVFTRNWGDASTNEIIRYDLSTDTELQLTSNSDDDHIPRWSPDGSQIAYTSNANGGNYDIWLMNADGSKQRPWISSGGWDEYAAWAPAWMVGPDGPLAFVTTADGSSELHLYADGVITRLSDHPGRDEWPSWWIEGEAIIYAREQNGSMNLYRLAVDASAWQVSQALQYSMPEPEPFFATESDLNEPAWSPLGDKIAYIQRWSGTVAYGELNIIDSTGENWRTLTTDAANPAWSPDGKWIVFSRGLDSNGDGALTDADDADIWAVRLSDGLELPLVEGEGKDTAPSWIDAIAEPPAPTATPAYDHAYITGITIQNSRYYVDFETVGFTPTLPGQHVHFFFNTVSPENAGLPGSGPWQLYPASNGASGASPFTLYKVNQRPNNATQMCILVANSDHSVQQGTGNCYSLP